MGDVKKMIDDKIAGKKVMVFSKTYCPFCQKAKKVFAIYLKKGDLSPEDYEVMEIENNPDCREIQNFMNKMTGASSVPRVFINGKCVGGGDDVQRLENNGQLAALLAK